MPSNEEDLIQQIVEEASMKTGKGAQFLPILIILEVVAALVSIWSDCHRKDQAAKMIIRAAQRPWAGSGPGVKVRAAIYSALPEPYKSPEFVEEIVLASAVKLRSGEINLD